MSTSLFTKKPQPQPLQVEITADEAQAARQAWTAPVVREPCPQHPDHLVTMPHHYAGTGPHPAWSPSSTCVLCFVDKAILDTNAVVDARYYRSKDWIRRTVEIVPKKPDADTAKAAEEPKAFEETGPEDLRRRILATVYPSRHVCCPECGHRFRMYLSKADLDRGQAFIRCPRRYKDPVTGFWVNPCGAGLMADLRSLNRLFTANESDLPSLITVEDPVPASETEAWFYFLDATNKKQRRAATVTDLQEAIDPITGVAQYYAELQIPIPQREDVHRALERQLGLPRGNITARHLFVRGFDIPKGMSAGMWWPRAAPEER